MIRAFSLARAVAGPCAALGVALATSAGAAPAAAPAAPAPATKPAAASTTKGLEWIESYDVALARAKKERKLVLLDFYTDWCGWCKRLDKDVFTQESFIKAADGVLGVKVNAEKKPELAARYQVSSYPRLFFLDSSGVTIERVKGYLSLADFTTRVEAVKRGDTEYARLRNAAMDPTDLLAAQRFAKYLSDDRHHDAALQYWQQVLDLSMQQIMQNPSAPGPMNSHREALVELARGYFSVGLDEVARQHYDEVLRVYSDDVMASGMALVGLAQIEMKKPSTRTQAVQRLDRVIAEYQGTPAFAEALRLKKVMAAGATPVPAKP